MTWRGVPFSTTFASTLTRFIPFLKSLMFKLFYSP
jgi:hypothetical protein